MIVRFRREYLIGHHKTSTISKGFHTGFIHKQTEFQCLFAALFLVSTLFNCCPGQHREILIEADLSALATIH